MSLPVSYRPDAVEDLDGFILVYGLYSPYVAERLAVLVKKQEDIIAEFPESGRVFYESLRAVLVRRYHLLMVYAVRATEIQVVALLDVRSDPERIRAVLRQRTGE